MHPVFVDNIPRECKVSDIRRLFSRYGTVAEVAIIKYHGFVTFESSREAVEAIRHLNGVSFMQSKLVVEASEELNDYLRTKRKEDASKKSRSPLGHERRRSRSRSSSWRRRDLKSSTDLLKRDYHSKTKESKYESSRSRSRDRSRSHKRHRERSRSRSQDEDDKRKRKSYKKKSKKSKQKKRSKSRNSKTPEVTQPATTNEIYANVDACPRQTFKMTIVNLLNPVEESDIRCLLETYGQVCEIQLSATEAVVTVQCSRQQAEEAIECLDGSDWMDNCISISLEDNAEAIGKQPSPQKNESVTDRECLNEKILEETETAAEILKDEKRIRERKLIVFCDSSSKTLLSDLSTVVFPKFGTVRSSFWNPDGKTITILLYSSEVDAVRCMSEVNGIFYKGRSVRVKFEPGSLEDSATFQRQYLDHFRNYPSKLIPTNDKSDAEVPTTTKEAPIGVLPPSSSLGAFGALPSIEALSSIIENVRRVSQEDKRIEERSVSAKSQNFSPSLMPYYVPHLADVDGRVECVSSRIILIKFSRGINSHFAKVTPGQVYVNGRKNLGCLLKNQPFHSWPEDIRSMLQQESVVKMDLQRLSSNEEREVQKVTSETVTYSAALVWTPNSRKPSAADLTISRAFSMPWVFKAVLICLFPQWGILRTHSGDVFFEAKHFFLNSARNQSSLLDITELGDILAVQCRSADYLEITELARGSAGFEGTTESIKFIAKLVWFLHAEVDPFAIDEPESESSVCQYLISSQTLNFPLPQEKDAHYKNLSGVIDEIHLPAGGVVVLDPGTVIGGQPLDDSQLQVYFHRSRITLNGTRVSTNCDLEKSLVPGDRVTVDVVPNDSLVSSEASWVAVSVRTQTTDRGISIANTLRMEGQLDPSSDVYPGRIVFLRRPEDGDPVSEGIAVIESGPYAGQRLEFDRSQCFVFGHRLNLADLSQIFGANESVYIQVKQYNSYLLDKLWLGGSDLTDPEELQRFRKFLFDHFIDELSFRYLVRGKFVTRPFIPLPGQIYKGRVRTIFEDKVDGPAVRMTVEALNVGEPLLVSVFREQLFVFGHSMEKADLHYIINDDEIFFELHQVFERKESSDCTMQRATLAWMGERPYYVGQSTRSVMSATQETQLWNFVKSKAMDEKMFRALVEGRLPPKNQNTAEKNVNIQIDSETLAQAALLKKMKEKFGSKSCLEAMMLLLKQSGESENDVESGHKPIDEKLLETMKDLEKEISKK